MSKYSEWRVAIHYLMGEKTYVVYRKKETRLPDMKDKFIVENYGEYPDREEAERKAAMLNMAADDEEA